MKNTVSKEFTSIEKDIVIPKALHFRMGSLILANRIQKNSRDKGKNKAFLIGDIQFVPSPRNDFSLEDTLYLVFQIYDLSEELRENGFIEYSIFRENLKGSDKVLSFTRDIKVYPDPMNFYEEFLLKNLSSDHYRIKVTLFNKNKEELLSGENNFYISLFTSIPRPWIISMPKPPSDNTVYLNILGSQFLNKKDIQEATALLEKACQKNPDSSEFAFDYSRALYAAKDYQRAKQIALPFFKSHGQYEFLGILGQSCQALGEFGEAISYYKDHLAHFGANIGILNSIGECYYKLGNNKEALIAWEKSLELDSKQENLTKIVEAIKQKK